ncbi:MAG: JAB domain-containing protein [Clostridia bacterium]|nr:JAB domain-containing protein [Clostridia bacterium]
MKWVLGHGGALKPALRSISRGMPGGIPVALLVSRREALFDAIKRVQAFMHKRDSTDAFMENLHRRYPAPLYFLESSRQALERSGVSRLDAFYYSLIPALTRTCLSQQWGPHPRLDNIRPMGEYLKTLYVGVHVECFYLILLDRAGRLIRPVLLQRGGVDNAPFYLRQLLAAALQEQARFIVLAHNHPGGTRRPSNDDLRCTLQALEAFAPLSIPLLDHVIVAGDAVVSIRGCGLLPGMLWNISQPGSRIVSGWLDDTNLNPFV